MELRHIHLAVILDTTTSPDGIVTSYRTIGDDIGRVICDAVLHSAHTHTVSAEPYTPCYQFYHPSNTIKVSEFLATR
jgi:hypothetical protein